eukprot:tig00021682_g23100.t1
MTTDRAPGSNAEAAACGEAAAHSAASAGEASASSSSEAQLSKNERKRRQMIARIHAKKAERQSAHDQMMAERALKKASRLATLPEEEVRKVAEANAKLRADRRARKEAERERLAGLMAGGPRLVVDLDFQEHASDGSSLARQLVDVWGINKRLERPWRVHVCGVGEAARRQLLPRLAGLQEWLVDLHEGEYIDVFKREELVYLSPDAPDVLETVDPSKVYILGAIIDRNVVKGLTQGKAERQGIASARLPLDRCPLEFRNSAFPLNHVFACMAALLGPARGDWAAAFRIALVRNGPSLLAASSSEPPGGAAGAAAQDGEGIARRSGGEAAPAPG